MPALSAVEQFFTQRVSGRPLALCRVGLGIASLLRAYPNHAMLVDVLSGRVVRAKEWPWIPDWPLEWAWLLTAAWMLASLTFAAGLFTRLSGSVLAASIFYRFLLDRNLFANHLYLMAVLAFLLTVADSGAWASLDNVWRKKRERDVTRWSTALIRVQISLVYFFSALAKMNGNFLDGTAFRQATRLAGLPTDVLVALAWGTVLMELMWTWALWVDRWRPSAVATATAFHVAIALSMKPPYAVTMVSFGMMMVMTFALYWEDGGPLARGHRLSEAAS